LKAPDKDVDQVRTVGRAQAVPLQRLHELRLGDRFVVRADENAGNGRLDADGLGEREQSREFLQTFGIGQMLVCESVERAHLRGDLHDHTEWSDGHHPLERLVEAAQARGYEYVIVSDHSRSLTIAQGLSVERLRQQRAEIRAVQARHTIRILAGSECDILEDGRLDFPDEVLAELDVVVASVHSRFKQDRATMTARIVRALENPHVDILGHPTGRRLGSREPYDVDLDAVFAAARAHGKAVEINASPERLDLNDAHARRAAEAGVPLSISTDTHYLSELDNIDLGIAVARRAWLGREQILNTRSLDDLLAWTRRG